MYNHSLLDTLWLGDKNLHLSSQWSYYPLYIAPGLSINFCGVEMCGRQREAHVVDGGDVDLASVGGGGVRDTETREEGLTDGLHNQEECYKQSRGEYLM